MTASAEAGASAPPVRERGLRTRAGNAMERTRHALLDGAARAVEKHGSRRTTMSDIATFAGVAKGTLYNHFRTKDAVYAAAIDAGVRGLTEECVTIADESLAEALVLAAERLGGHPALRRVAAEEPAVLAALVTPGESAAWQQVRDSVRYVLDAAARDAADASVEVVLRWLVSFIATPGVAVEAQAAVLAAGLPAEAQPQLQF